MTSIKAIIVDDEPLAHKVVLKYASDLPFIEIVGQCNLATEAYAMINQKEVDLIFLDINMPKLKGLDFLRTLNKKPHVIITSAYEEYALEGYELQVADYLLKPFRFERFLKAVNIVKEKMEASIAASSNQEFIFLKVDKKQIQVDISDIQYLESFGNYVKVWLDTKFHLTPRTLTSFENELADEFIRIHKSYIIQKSFINFIEGNAVNMQNGNTVTIGKSYKSMVKELLG